MNAITCTLFLGLAIFLSSGVGAELPVYTVKELPTGILKSPRLNDKNQVVGVEGAKTVKLYMPEPDLLFPEAGVHTIPVADEIQSVEFIDFNNNGGTIGRFNGVDQGGFFYSFDPTNYTPVSGVALRRINNQGVILGEHLAQEIYAASSIIREGVITHYRDILDHTPLHPSMVRHPEEDWERGSLFEIQDINNNGMMTGYRSDWIRFPDPNPSSPPGLRQIDHRPFILPVDGNLTLIPGLPDLLPQIPLPEELVVLGYTFVPEEMPQQRVHAINDKNQVLGSWIQSLGNRDRDDHFWLYLPEPDYGLPAGINHMDPDPLAFSNYADVELTNNGVAFFRFTNQVWHLGEHFDPSARLASEEVSVSITTLHDINSGGVILAEGSVDDGPATLFLLDPEPDYGLSVTMEFTDREPKDELRLGDEFGVRLSVEVPTGGVRLTDLAFADPVGLAMPTPLEIVESPESTDIGALDPGDSFVLEWRLKAAHPGRFVLGHQVVSGITPEGFDVVADEAELNGSIAGFDVAIVLPEDPLVLERLEADGDPDDGTGYQPLEFEVRVEVSVPDTGEPIENVTLQGFDASDGGLDIDLVESTGIETAPWADVQPQPVPAPVWVSERSPVGVLTETQPGGEPGGILVLQPGGEPGVFVVKVTAEKPGTFEIAALITAAPEGGGNTITGRGTNVADIKGDLVLAIQLEVVNDPARITEGEAVEITGTVENLTLDETIFLDPLLVISTGQGVPLGPVPFEEELPPAAVPGIFNPQLEPGQSERFRLRVETVALPGFDQREMGRTSVIVDFAVSGKVLSNEEDAELRDLALEEIQVEWGNGRHEVKGATFLRAQVDPDFRPSRELSQENFFGIAAGKALENLARGGQEFVIVEIPNLLQSLPPALWSLANVGGNLPNAKREASYNAARYLWAWVDLQIDIFAGLRTDIREQQLAEITTELTAYYGPQFENAEKVKELVDNAISGYFEKVIDYQKRAYDASSYGFNEELADIVGEPFRPIGKLAVEEAVAAAAIASWIGRTSRSTQVLDEVAESRELFIAKSRREVDAATADMVRRGDPRITEMSDPMKALPATTPLTQKHAIDGWGMDRVSDENLIKMTNVKNGGMPIFVAIRSRADETIEWMKTQLGITPKPMTFKPKNVNADDVMYLGYRDGVGYGDANGVGAGDRGATLLAEPIPRELVEKRLKDAGADAVTRTRVLKRHDDRWKEWYGNVCCNKPASPKSKVTELKNRLTFDPSTGVGKGTLGVPQRGSVPNPEINADTVGPGIMDARQFEMRQVKNPPDDEYFTGGRQYFECWLEDDLATPTRRGTLRRIAGDIDTVAVGLADGSALPVASTFAETVAANILHAIQGQHPWSSSLIKKIGDQELDLFEEFVNNGTHRWHDDITKRGEPLIIYVNGKRRVGWFHPTRTITSENPLKNFLWLDGGTADVDNVIRFQKDLRGNLPDPSDVNPPLVKPTTSVIREALLGSDIKNGTDFVASCIVTTARSGGTLYRLSNNTVFEKRSPGGDWEPADPAAACGQDGGIVVMPETFITSDIVSGTLRIPIIEDLLGYDWRQMFQVGDQIVIGEGTPEEAHRRIESHGSLVLDRPLTFNYPMGTQVISLGLVLDDADDDGLSNDLERDLGTDPNLPDTDGDGVEDFTEVDRGTDPLVPDNSPESVPTLTIHRLPNGEIEVRWPEDLLGELEQSGTLRQDSWLPVPDLEGGAPDGLLRLSPDPAQRTRFFRLRNN